LATDDPDRQFERELDRVWLYRLAETEKRSKDNLRAIEELRGIVSKLTDTLPARYILREELERETEKNKNYTLQVWVVIITGAQLAIHFLPTHL